jgi:hypothetical protein
VYEPTTAKPLGQLYKPHRTRRQLEGKMHTQWPMSADTAVGPAILINRFGKGTVVTCAGSPDYASASEHALVEDRVLFRNMFRILQQQGRLRIDAPSNVEVVVTDQPDTRKLRIHLLAYNPTPRTTPQTNRPFVLPGMIEDKPIFRITMATSDRILGVESLNPSTRVRRSDHEVEATLEDIHEVLILDYEIDRP